MTIAEIQAELRKLPKELKGIKLQKHIRDIGARALQRARDRAGDNAELVQVCECWGAEV